METERELNLQKNSMKWYLYERILRKKMFEVRAVLGLHICILNNTVTKKFIMENTISQLNSQSFSAIKWYKCIHTAYHHKEPSLMECQPSTV